MDFWTSASAPWWLSVVTLLIGLLGAHFTTKFADDRRFNAEDKRQGIQRQSDRDEYLANRVLDEVALLLTVGEEFRLYLYTSLTLLRRTEDGNIDTSDEETKRSRDAVYNDSDDVLHRFRAQLFRAQMIVDGDLAAAVDKLNKAGRRYWVSGTSNRERFEKAHVKYSKAMREVRRTAHDTVLGSASR
jgi:hypothetical protein